MRRSIIGGLMIAATVAGGASAQAASSTSLRTTVSATGAFSRHSTLTGVADKCEVGPGPEGWLLSIPGRGPWFVQVTAVHHSHTIQADTTKLGSSNFHVELDSGRASAGGEAIEWSAGLQLPHNHQGSGSFKVSKVRMSGLPGHAKYALVGSIDAIMPGVTIGPPPTLGNGNPAGPSYTTKGTVHLKVSLACWTS